MDRTKMRVQAQKLRNKKVIQKTIIAVVKPKNGVVKLQSFSTKRTAPVAPPVANKKIIKKSFVSSHTQIMNSAKSRHKSTGGCGSCRRKMGR